MGHRMYKTIGCVLLVVGGSLVLLFVLEFATRLYSSLFFPKMMILDGKLGWRHARNVSKKFQNEDLEVITISHNKHGHRGRDYGPERLNGKYRVLILGDSFTEGVHVKDEELFSSRLENLNPEIEAINAGIGGYGTVQEYLYLTSEGLRFRPDLVLLMFFENDLDDNCLSYYPGFGPRPYAVLRDGEIEIIERLEYEDFQKFVLPVPLWTFLSRRSYLYYFVNVYVYQRIFAEKMRQLQRLDLEKTRRCGRHEIFNGLIVKIRNLLAADGVQFGVVLIPSRDEVENGSSKTQQSILGFCREYDVNCVALLNRLMERRALGDRLYFSVDIHLTKDGHKIVAEEIDGFITTLRRSQPGTRLPAGRKGINSIPTPLY